MHESAYSCVVVFMLACVFICAHERFYARTSVFVRAQVCLGNGKPVYVHVDLCMCKCVFEHVRNSLHA